ncbi:MAG: hypothetical protein KIT10_09145 [Flavobacteriales bacterium]|nr:hypothetical protein [Flavobacteriales bacterium]
MRSLRILGATLFLASAMTQAQSFDVGTNVLSASVGIGGYYGASSAYTSQTPALGLSYEKGITRLGPGELGLGGYLGYKTLANRYSGPGFEYDWSWTYLILGVRGAWHYNTWHDVDQLDLYGGLLLSYNSVKWKDNTTYPSGFPVVRSSAGSGMALTGFIGARYYFTESLGAHMELGYGIATANLGLSYKF